MEKSHPFHLSWLRSNTYQFHSYPTCKNWSHGNIWMQERLGNVGPGQKPFPRVDSILRMRKITSGENLAISAIPYYWTFRFRFFLLSIFIDKNKLKFYQYNTLLLFLFKSVYLCQNSLRNKTIVIAYIYDLNMAFVKNLDNSH